MTQKLIDQIVDRLVNETVYGRKTYSDLTIGGEMATDIQDFKRRLGSLLGNVSEEGVGDPEIVNGLPNMYIATLTQSGTNAPVATVFQNTLGGEIVWSRTSPGSYKGTLAGVFTENKTIIPPFTQNAVQVIPIYKNTWLDFGYTLYRASDNVVQLLTMDSNGDNTEMFNAVSSHSLFVEIRVYP